MTIKTISGAITLAIALSAPQTWAAICAAKTGATRNPVIELYTSEGCSSCPPADRWLSTLTKAPPSGVVALAFHVSYWDYIGWVDRFASPALNERQRELARREQRRGVYTPQLVRDGADWPRWYSASAGAALVQRGGIAPGADISLSRNRAGVFEAEVTPRDPRGGWSAYWAVTEDGHATKVRAGENKGEKLAHDFVVRQYEPVATQRGAVRLVLKPAPAEAGHLQRVNLVVTQPTTGVPLQAISLACP